MAVFRSELAHAQVDVVQNKLDTRNLSTSRRLVRRTDNLRSFFLRVITYHTHAHTSRRFCGRSGTVSSITSPQTCFVGPPKNTSLASRTGVTSLPDAGTFAQPHVCVGTTPCQLVRRLVPVWLFEPAEMGRSTAKTGVSSYPWSFFGTRAVPAARILPVDAELSALGSQAESLGYPVLLGSVVGPCCPYAPQNTARTRVSGLSTHHS